MYKPKNFKASPFEKFNNIETEQNFEPKNDKPKKAGRPKTKQGEYKTINISVPVEILEKLKNIKAVYQGNLTFYVNKLIEKDLGENYEKYLEIVDMNIFK